MTFSMTRQDNGDPLTELTAKTDLTVLFFHFTTNFDTQEAYQWLMLKSLLDLSGLRFLKQLTGFCYRGKHFKLDTLFFLIKIDNS